MRRRPPVSTRTDTLFPYTTLFRSIVCLSRGGGNLPQRHARQTMIAEQLFRHEQNLLRAFWIVLDTAALHSELTSIIDRPETMAGGRRYIKTEPITVARDDERRVVSAGVWTRTSMWGRDVEKKKTNEIQK